MTSPFGYEFFDSRGFAIGFFVFFIVLIYSFFLLQKHDLNRRIIIGILILSCAGHFIGSILNYWFSITAGSDSVMYFQQKYASDRGKWGFYFAEKFLEFLKTNVSDSFMSMFFLFGSLGLLASVYFFLTFKTLLDQISNNQKLYCLDRKQLFFPALVILCWPSYFFWSAGLVKDSFAFLSVALLLYAIARGKVDIQGLITFCIGSALGLVVRPYLFVIVALSVIIYVLLSSKMNYFFKIGILVLLGIATSMVMPMLSSYNLSFLKGSVTTIGQQLIYQQQVLSVGSSIPVPTSDPRLIFFCLPYLFFANLFLPLGFGASNFIGVVSSIENAYLVWCVFFFFKNKLIWSQICKNVRILKFLFIYFVVGMSCLSAMCTNLGLAMREKIMYVPALLICFSLVYSYRRILIIRHYLQKQA